MAFSTVELPPITNRGATTHKGFGNTSPSNEFPSSVCLDWISGTIELDNFPSVAEYLIERFGEEYGLATPCAPGRGYSFGVRTLSGIRISWREDGSRAYLVVPGSALRTLTTQEQQHLLVTLFQQGFNCTRIDAARDWYRGLLGLSIPELWSWCRAGYLAGGRKYQLLIGNPQYCPSEICDHYGHEIWELTGKQEVTDPDRFGDCHTLSIGSRGKTGSGYYTRIYEKGAQYGASSPWVRAETEFVKKRAHQVFCLLIEVITESSIDEYRECLSNLSLYRVSFEFHSDRSNGSGRKVIPAWLAVREDRQPLTLPPLAKRVFASVNLYHFAKQYRGFLAKLRLLEPSRFLSILLCVADSGLEKLMAAKESLVPSLTGSQCLLAADGRQPIPLSEALPSQFCLGYQ